MEKCLKFDTNYGEVGESVRRSKSIMQNLSAGSMKC